MTRPGSVAIVQTTVPDYRHRFFDALRAALGHRLTLVAGSEDFSVDVAHKPGAEQVLARNRFFAGRRLLWQSRVLGAVSRADVVVVTLNPRILSNWAVLLRRRLARRPTIVWGHAWPRTGSHSRTDVVRNAMRGLASGVIVYTETEARELRAKWPGIAVTAAPNALYAADELRPVPSSAPPTDILFVGRLHPAKKPGLLLAAFRLALPELADDVRLVLVGDGPLREELLREVAGHQALSERVVLPGHVSGIDELRELYRTAIVSVSPGYAGLSLTQSHGFGVAMIVARDEPHAPEIEAAIDGENAVIVPSDDPRALSDALLAFCGERSRWLERREAISEAARATYSIEGMVSAYVGALSPPRTPHSTPEEDG